MGRYYLDTSALLKRHLVTEHGSDWMRQLCAPSAGRTLIIAGITEVEVASALARLTRGTQVGLKEAQRRVFIGFFRRHARVEYTQVAIAPAVVRRAADLCRTRSLRAYDAVQLACALTARDDARMVGGAVTFVSADEALLLAAAAEGFTIENPQLH